MKDNQPAIRFVDYMSGRKEMESIHIVGPYPDDDTRNKDLHRLRNLPVGAPEYNGGIEFLPATMGEAVGEQGWSLFVVEPTQVANAVTVRGFLAAFHGHDEESDEQPPAKLKPVYGSPEADPAEPCDEFCDPGCVHHMPSVGWDLSFGSRINFHPVDTKDGRMVVSLHLGDDAVDTGMVYREVQPQQLETFARQLLELATTALASTSNMPTELRK